MTSPYLERVIGGMVNKSIIYSIKNLIIGEINKVTKSNFLKGMPGVLVLIGQVKGAKKKREEVRFVKDPLNHL